VEHLPSSRDEYVDECRPRRCEIAHVIPFTVPAKDQAILKVAKSPLHEATKSA